MLPSAGGAPHVPSFGLGLIQAPDKSPVVVYFHVPGHTLKYLRFISLTKFVLIK